MSDHACCINVSRTIQWTGVTPLVLSTAVLDKAVPHRGDTLTPWLTRQQLKTIREIGIVAWNQLHCTCFWHRQTLVMGERTVRAYRGLSNLVSPQPVGASLKLELTSSRHQAIQIYGIVEPAHASKVRYDKQDCKLHGFQVRHSWSGNREVTGASVHRCSLCAARAVRSAGVQRSAACQQRPMAGSQRPHRGSRYAHIASRTCCRNPHRQPAD
jgi:hypothetical protein